MQGKNFMKIFCLVRFLAIPIYIYTYVERAVTQVLIFPCVFSFRQERGEIIKIVKNKRESAVRGGYRITGYGEKLVNSFRAEFESKYRRKTTV